LCNPDQHQLHLTPENRPPPEGFVYRPDVLSVPAERLLVERIRELPLKEFDFHGFTARRRTISFGWHYDFARSRLDKADDIPAWLLPLRETVAAFAALEDPRRGHDRFTSASTKAATPRVTPVLNSPHRKDGGSSWSRTTRKSSTKELSTSSPPVTSRIHSGTEK
jgi:hypothetical protein